VPGACSRHLGLSQPSKESELFCFSEIGCGIWKDGISGLSRGAR
jgi:hypothetical protein